MAEVFISYARSTAKQAQTVAETLRGLGHSVWLDDELPAHRAYTDVIEERLRAAKAVVVIWSAEAVKSEWVQSEADRARNDHKLVQLRIDGTALPMPFDRIQCADLTGWTGAVDAPGWRKVTASIGELISGETIGVTRTTNTLLPLPAKPSIAVMPFTNLSGDAEQDYFADGMVEEITATLTRYRSIFVIASSSTQSFKGKAVSAQEIGRQLGIRYVLEGSVRKAGGRVRIAIKLIDASDGAQIWAERFEDTLEDVFALQDRVALAVAGKIEPTVQQAEIRRASSRPTDNMGSYDLYLRALPLHRTFERDGVLGSLALLQRSIGHDPDFGPALALAALGHRLIDAYGWSDDPDGNRRRGAELSHRALATAGDDAEVLALVANFRSFVEHDDEGALALLNKAVALNPGSAMAWFHSGIVRLRAGETELGVQSLETAMRLDPMGALRAQQVGFMGQARFQQGRFGEAVPLLKELVGHTDNPRGHAFLVACHGHLGQRLEASEHLARFRASSAQSIEEVGRNFLADQAHLKLFLAGIALAERAAGDA